MFKKMGIRGKMLLSICGVFLLSSMVTISYITIKASSMARTEAEDKALEISYKHGSMVQSEINNAMDVARTVAHTFEGIKNSNIVPDRKVMDEILRQVLVQNPGIIAIDTCWEPNALDGRDLDFAGTPGHDATGRYVPYWNRGSGKIEVEPLVNFDTEPWYQVPKMTGKEIFTEPYLYPVGGHDVLMATVVAPIMQNKKFLGMVAIDFSMDAFTKMIDKIKPFGTGYAYLLSNNGYIVAHPVQDMVGKIIQEVIDPEIKNELSKAIKGGETYMMLQKSTEKNGDSFQVLTPIQVGMTDTPWSLGIVVPVDQIMKGARSLRNMSLIIGLVSMLIICCVIYFISEQLVVRPIGYVVNSLKDISEGDGNLTMRIDVRSQDEIGVLGINFNTFVSKLQSMIGEISENAKSMDRSSSALLTDSRELSSLAMETSSCSDTVAAAAEEMSSNINSVAASMEQASSNTSMVAAAAEEMAATITEIAMNTEKAREISESAVTESRNTAIRMGELEKAAKDIGVVTETISNISAQTNLLALNATIEAARAGEAGKGFAVVANEIKTLATQTAEATKDIKAKIDSIQSVTGVTTKDIDNISRVIKDVNDIIFTIATAVEEQSAATAEIAENISQASNGIHEVNENVNQSSMVIQGISKDISGVSQISLKMSSSTSNAHANTEGMAKLTANLKEIVGRFVI